MHRYSDDETVSIELRRRRQAEGARSGGEAPRVREIDGDAAQVIRAVREDRAGQLAAGTPVPLD